MSDQEEEGGILCVCTGNLCRSPFAAEFFSLRGRPATSAGIYAVPGQPATPQGIQAAAEHDVDLTGHQAALVHRAMYERASLVLAMEPLHREDALAVLGREAEDKVVLLAARAFPDDPLIPDPFGASVEIYRQVYDKIAEAVEAWL